MVLFVLIFYLLVFITKCIPRSIVYFVLFYVDNGQEVTISVPLLSIYEIKRFPKQYLENEKLAMLNDGIEIITSNFLSVKVTILSLSED